MTPEERRARTTRSTNAINSLREDPSVIVIRRWATSADGTIPGEWTVSTARHNTTHRTIDLDALLMVKVLMTQQEKDLP